MENEKQKEDDSYHKDLIEARNFFQKCFKKGVNPFDEDYEKMLDLMTKNYNFDFQLEIK